MYVWTWSKERGIWEERKREARQVCISACVYDCMYVCICMFHKRNNMQNCIHTQKGIHTYIHTHTLQLDEKKHAEEVQFLKRTNTQLKQQLENILAPSAAAAPKK